MVFVPRATAIIDEPTLHDLDASTGAGEHKIKKVSVTRVTRNVEAKILHVLGASLRDAPMLR